MDNSFKISPYNFKVVIRMRVDEFMRKFEVEVKRMDVDEADKMEIMRKVTMYLKGKSEVSQNDVQIIKRIIIPATLWRGW